MSCPRHIVSVIWMSLCSWVIARGFEGFLVPFSLRWTTHLLHLAQTIGTLLYHRKPFGNLMLKILVSPGSSMYDTLSSGAPLLPHLSLIGRRADGSEWHCHTAAEINDPKCSGKAQARWALWLNVQVGRSKVAAKPDED
ncbi:uncharacterized protein B0T23DRAFT_96261 [Neurospora hispaniola]|uniref:Uncharacterized protein n=1 Tax=Neurospora hispaniola TaxID=588809 RepID=A0AAJ0IDZ5_9PEZI|nr:hypothetical protein B0T23DRAFT_96261 [Neurospora hispaniola]